MRDTPRDLWNLLHGSENRECSSCDGNEVERKEGEWCAEINQPDGKLHVITRNQIAHTLVTLHRRCHTARGRNTSWTRSVQQFFNKDETYIAYYYYVLVTTRRDNRRLAEFFDGSLSLFRPTAPWIDLRIRRSTVPVEERKKTETEIAGKKKKKKKTRRHSLSPSLCCSIASLVLTERAEREHASSLRYWILPASAIRAPTPHPHPSRQPDLFPRHEPCVRAYDMLRIPSSRSGLREVARGVREINTIKRYFNFESVIVFQKKGERKRE